jgi:3-dehydroquinate synthase
MSSHCLQVTRQENCRIEVAAGLRSQLGALVKESLPKSRHCVIVSDTCVAGYWLDEIETQLKGHGFALDAVTLEPGESSKSYPSLAKLWDALLAAGCDRDSVVIALGGGVIGDLAGFAASTLLRGVALIQVPTSLLAQIDAAIGGKTAINHKSGKNLIGTFHHARLVVVDPEMLHTLPAREFRAGTGEMLKYGYIRDPQILDSIRTAPGPALQQPSSLARLTELIDRCVAIKAKIVQEDAREQSLRAILNYGHTVGHALEAATRFQEYLHGEAVGIGMRAAAHLAAQLQRGPSSLCDRLLQDLQHLDLPYNTPHLPSELTPFLATDKKRRRGQSRWILVREPGRTEICTDPPEAAIQAALQAIHEPE